MAPTDDIAALRNFILNERKKAVSDREWKHRLTGYGYAIKDTPQGRMVTSLLKGGNLCVLG